MVDSPAIRIWEMALSEYYQQNARNSQFQKSYI